MNKGLEAIRFAIRNFASGSDYNGNYYTREDIETELKRLEELDKKFIKTMIDFAKLKNEHYDLKEILRIIKEKEVDIYFLKRMLIERSSLYNSYGNDEKARKNYNEIHDKKLTKQEFNLLKEWLK